MTKYFLNRDDIDVDPEDFNGRRTPLYLAAKSNQEEAVKLLIANGASIKNVAYGKTVQQLIKENCPHLNPVSNEQDQSIMHFYSMSSLGFLNPTSQLKCTDVTAFCMKLRNSEDR